MHVRSLVLVPLVIVVLAGAGWLACRLMSVNAHAREMLLAGGICLVAGEAALVPLLLTRGASQPAVAQAGLAGTMVHLLVAIVLASPFFLRSAQDLSMVYWLLAFYLATLVVIVAASAQAVKAAPVQTSAPK